MTEPIEPIEFTITHRGWERLGAGAPAWRQRNLGGWSGLLPHYRQALGS